jgi:hypothetical protein
MPDKSFELDAYEHAIFSEKRFFTRRETESSKDLLNRAEAFLKEVTSLHPDARLIKAKNGKNILIVWEAKI